jgi:hypothetical protein
MVRDRGSKGMDGCPLTASPSPSPEPEIAPLAPKVFTDMFVDHSFCADSDRIPLMADEIFWIHSHGILNKIK